MASEQTRDVAGAAEAVSAGVQSVTAASEDLVASIGEIGPAKWLNCTRITSKAVSNVQHPDTVVLARWPMVPVASAMLLWGLLPASPARSTCWR